MISSAEDFKKYIKEDNHQWVNSSKKYSLIAWFCHEPSYLIAKYLYYLRKEEYFINTANGSKLKGALGLFYDRKKNRLGNLLGIQIDPNCFESGLTIYHPGSIVVNPAVRVGKNCKLHGGNCIGNNGINNHVPHIGNNVDIGYGAVIIGDIEIADNVIIGANAVVNKSIKIPGSVVVGVPGKMIER